VSKVRTRNKELKAAAKELTAIAERQLSKLSKEEQEARAAAFARVTFTSTRGNREGIARDREW